MPYTDVSRIIHPNHISKSAIAALTLPDAPAAIIRVVAIGTAQRLARNAARISFAGGWSLTDLKNITVRAFIHAAPSKSSNDY
jgi:hypothetical protein